MAGTRPTTGLVRPGETLVVISPHLDDAVLSLGAAIAGTARRGGRVIVLTVLAGDPASAVPAGGWDRSAGFETHGAAARARRLEDGRACATLGATSSWLPYGDEQYERGGDDATVWASILEAVGGAHAALVPGSPLSHSDHAWLARLCLTHALPCQRIGIYAEQPYTWLTTGSPIGVPVPIAGLVPAGIAWERSHNGAGEVLARIRACRAYRSQLPLLGRLRLLRAVASDVKRGGEAIAWLAS
jgi:LmbE family N-acetylglucosaminyl deacetylase